MKRKLFLLIFLTIICAGGGWYLFGGIDSIKEKNRAVKLFPEIANKVAKINIEQGDVIFTMQLADSGGSGLRWVLPDYDFYPADTGKVTSFILSFANLALSKKYTTDEGRFASLGVSDNSVEDGSSRVTFLGREGEELGSVILGLVPFSKDSAGMSTSEPLGQYIRKAGDNQVYFVNDIILPKTKITNWIITNLITVDINQIVKIIQQDTAGAGVLFMLNALPGNPNDVQFKLDTNNDMVSLSDEQIYLVKSGIQNFQIEDAYKEASLNEVDNPLYGRLNFDLLTTYVLKNGVIYKVYSAESFKRTYVKIEVGFDENVYKDYLSVGKDSTETSGGIQNIREQIARVNQNYVGWVYLVPKYANARFRIR